MSSVLGQHSKAQDLHELKGIKITVIAMRTLLNQWESACQNFWRPCKAFNLENVTKNDGPMSNFVMKTIGSVEITVFQKRECWLWRSLLFLKGLKEHSSWTSSTANDNFLGERAKISHRLMLKYDLSVVYIRGVDLCIQARKEKKRFLSLTFITFLSLCLSFNCCIPWSSTDLQEITGYSGTPARPAEHHG